MSDKQTDLVPQKAPRTFSLMPSSLGEAKEIALLIAGSDFATKDYKGKPENVMIAIQMGADIGLSPMQALQNIAVINGRPSIYGDAALALAMSVLERFHETFEGAEGTDAFMAVCVAKRKGWPDETRRTFSVADAKAAKLWLKRGRDGQDTPWVTYPKRMLQFRARGFTLRDVAADLLLGLVLAEEAMDYPAIEGTVVASEPVPSPAPKSRALVAFEGLPEGVRDNIEKAFATLNIANGLRLARLNEFLGADGVDVEAGAHALLDWCREEYAKRRTGQPRKAKGTGKEKPAATTEAKSAMAPSELPQERTQAPLAEIVTTGTSAHNLTVSPELPPPTGVDEVLF